jgi:hypothetical protein
MASARNLYTLPSLFAGLDSAVLQICGVAPRIKYITGALKWIGARKLLENSNRSSNHAA